MTSANSIEKTKMFLVDTDAGVDDAQALAMAIGKADASVVAITTVQGNVAAGQVTINVLRILSVLQTTNIPVYQGCELPLMGTKIHATNCHGKDGLGDLQPFHEVGGAGVQSEHAVTAIIRLVKENPNKISLVCLGPLTNIAMAVRLYPELGKNLKECSIMGGNYRGTGNITPSAEFNFYNDPEAAHVVLSSLKCPIKLITWELCLGFPLDWDKYEAIFHGSSRAIKFLKMIQKVYFENIQNTGFPLVICDQIAMAVAIDSTLVTESSRVFADIELAGPITRGQMVVDWRTNNPPNFTLVTKIDFKRLIRTFTTSLRNIDSRNF